MPALENLDVQTLVGLAAPAVADSLLSKLRAQGFDGVKVSHGYVVQRLLEDEPTVGSLAASLGITQQGASKQVADLESLGYVERVLVPGDQRARRVRLTPRGRAMVEAAREARAEQERRLVEVVGPRKVAAARQALAALLDEVGLREPVRTRRVAPPSD